jgi:hypothetical protein
MNDDTRQAATARYEKLAVEIKQAEISLAVKRSVLLISLEVWERDKSAYDDQLAKLNRLRHEMTLILGLGEG